MHALVRHAALAEAAEEVVCVRVDHEVGDLVLDFLDDDIEVGLRARSEELLDETASLLRLDEARDVPTDLLDIGDVLGPRHHLLKHLGCVRLGAFLVEVE
jgi:hypothetical protein